MIKYILKKLLQMIPMLLVISLIVFLGLRATGVDPITYMVSMEVQAQSPEIVEQLRENLGLNDPLIVQYFNWLKQIVTGDLGYSFGGQSIASIGSSAIAIYTGIIWICVGFQYNYWCGHWNFQCSKTKWSGGLCGKSFCSSRSGSATVFSWNYFDTDFFYQVRLVPFRKPSQSRCN